MMDQFTLLQNAILSSVSLKQRKFLEIEKEGFQKLVVTLVEIANCDRATDTLHYLDRSNTLFSRLDEYKVPTGFNWSRMMQHNNRVASREIMLRRAKFCTTTSRPKYAEDANMTEEEIKKLVMSPVEMFDFFTILGSIDKITFNTAAISKKDDMILENIFGFYSSVDDCEKGELRTMCTSGNPAMSQYEIEFFGVTDVNSNHIEESVSTYPVSFAEFKSWLAMPLNKESDSGYEGK